tara:strand:+ start:403 stop:1887 length:1485 start_codon:yes stop_codon:yes gene_type:complete
MSNDDLSDIQAEWDKEDEEYESGVGNSKNDDEESHVDGMNEWLVDNTDDIFNDIMKDQKKAPGYVLNPLQKKVMNLIKGLEMNPVNKGKLLFAVNGSANSGYKKPINYALSEADYLGNNKQVLITIIVEYVEKLKASKQGGFFFNKKKSRKRRKKTKGKKKKKRKSRKKKKKTRKKKEAKKKDRKFTDTSYPYRMITKKEAIDDFLSLREMVNKKDFNSKSVLGNRAVDYGTEKARKKTKYRNKSHYERWQDKVAREKVLKFAKRLYKQKYKRSVDSSIRGAIELQWGSINTMRPAAAACAYKKNKATKVLDFTAGWGARLIAAMALDMDYTGIDANKALKPGYDKIIKTLKPYSKSKVKMIFKKAETVDISKLKYDFVFTSPPYEYLEVYENMENYEKKGEKVSQPYSSSKIKIDDSEKFYDEFMIPTLKEIYKYLPKGKYICLNMPDIMYTKIKKKWKKMDKKDVYSIVGRVGGPEDFKRMEKEQIFCWKKH